MILGRNGNWEGVYVFTHMYSLKFLFQKHIVERKV